MKIGIMQPYFFPYLGYWQLLNAVDKYVIFDDVNYIKRGWINRNKILYNEAERYINVFLKHASQNKLINEIEIGDKENNHNNMRIIHEAYHKAPFYNDVFPVIEKIINQDAPNLARYNGFIIDSICKYLDIKTEIIYSSELIKDNSLKGEEKIIDICQNLKADCYYNAIGGRELYHKEKFACKKIDLYFLKMKDISYKQFGKIFVPGLSIIDALMFNDVETVQNYLTCFELVGGGKT